MFLSPRWWIFCHRVWPPELVCGFFCHRPSLEWWWIRRTRGDKNPARVHFPYKKPLTNPPEKSTTQLHHKPRRPPLSAVFLGRRLDHMPRSPSPNPGKPVSAHRRPTTCHWESMPRVARCVALAMAGMPGRLTRTRAHPTSPIVRLTLAHRGPQASATSADIGRNARNAAKRIWAFGAVTVAANC